MHVATPTSDHFRLLWPLQELVVASLHLLQGNVCGRHVLEELLDGLRRGGGCVHVLIILVGGFVLLIFILVGGFVCVMPAIYIEKWGSGCRAVMLGFVSSVLMKHGVMRRETCIFGVLSASSLIEAMGSKFSFLPPPLVHSNVIFHFKAMVQSIVILHSPEDWCTCRTCHARPAGKKQ
jgi:hypothetical protein